MVSHFKSSFAVFLLFVGSDVVRSQIPAIPEPPILLYGTVMDGTTNQPVAITSVVWQVSDGTENRTFTAALPTVKILEANGQSFYRLEIPMEMRSALTPTGSLTLTPSASGLPVKSPSPTYTLTAIINGRATTIKTVDAATQPANTPSVSFSDYTPATQGRMTRVDLTLKPLDPYADWAALNFPNPNDPKASRTADPDGDGATNEQEFLAGTNPNSANSVLSITSSTVNPNGTWSVSFQTIPGKKYRLLSSTDLSAFNPEGATFTATNNSTALTLGNGFRKFIKLEIVPE